MWRDDLQACPKYMGVVGSELACCGNNATTKARMKTSKIFSDDDPGAVDATGFSVYALVRPSSKYAYQGVVSGVPVMMRLTRVDDRDEYAFHLENGNRYRREDLTFFAKSSSGIVIKLR